MPSCQRGERDRSERGIGKQVKLIMTASNMSKAAQRRAGVIMRLVLCYLSPSVKQLFTFLLIFFCHLMISLSLLFPCFFLTFYHFPTFPLSLLFFLNLVPLFFSLVLCSSSFILRYFQCFLSSSSPSLSSHLTI